ncbi:alpha/beta fold hydrolase [Nonomuraea longicatena]
MITKAMGLVLAAGLLPGAPATPPDGLHECASATTRCEGTIEVPLDWGNTDSERISVAFVWIPAEKAGGTVVGNMGGPLPALPFEAEIKGHLGPVLQQKNLLIMDPRGMGKSSPLRCEGVDFFQSETVAACAKTVGPRGAFFTADQASHDLDAIRRALGLGKVSYYGNSYGTMFAQAYAAYHPDSLDAMFLDSAMLIDEDGYAAWGKKIEKLHALDAACKPSKACDALPGSPSGTWTRLVERLRERPDPEVTIFQTFQMTTAEDPVIGRELVAAANAYLRGDPAPLRRLAKVFAKTSPPGHHPDPGGYLAYRCGDANAPFDRFAAKAEREEQAQRYHDRVRPMEPYRISDLTTATDIAAAEWCVNWPTPRHSPPRPPARALPDIPVMVVAGDMDVNPPAEVARSMRAFPNATVLRVPFAPHAITRHPGPVGDCARGLLRTFLTTKRVDGQRCSGENYRAVGAYPQQLSDVAPYPARILDADHRRLPGTTAHPAHTLDADHRRLSGTAAHPTRILDAGQRRVLAATIATAADAASRRNPNILYYRMTSEPGLRGGQVIFGQDISLDGARFVRDLRVSGPITLTAGGRATATLAAETGGRTHRVTLTWQPFTTEPSVSGTFDGVRF